MNKLYNYSFTIYICPSGTIICTERHRDWENTWGASIDTILYAFPCKQFPVRCFLVRVISSPLICEEFQTIKKTVLILELRTLMKGEYYFALYTRV